MFVRVLLMKRIKDWQKYKYLKKKKNKLVFTM